MFIHEYEAKEWMRSFGLPVPRGHVVHALDSVEGILKFQPIGPWVIKAQLHAGARGKAGGIITVQHREALVPAVASLLGHRLKTAQTAAEGQIINAVLIEEKIDIAQEWYVSCRIDRDSSPPGLVVMISRNGGVNIENHAEVLHIPVDNIVGWMPYQARFAYDWGLDHEHVAQLSSIISRSTHMMKTLDLILFEINPLAITPHGDIVCLDAKITVDDNALYRQDATKVLEDDTQYDVKELRASAHGLHYVALDGSIACMVNGAGLAMATMDIIQCYKGKAANFLDVGGDADSTRVAEGFRIIASDPHVKAIFIHIFGGIVRCDMIAKGILEAVKDQSIHLPIVVRFIGNQAAVGIKMLQHALDNIIVTEDFAHAARTVVALAHGESA